MAKIPVLVYVGEGNVDKKLVEALLACRGDRVCAKVLVEAGVATGESIASMERRGRLVEAQVDLEKFRGVNTVGSLAAMIGVSEARGLRREPLERVVDMVDAVYRSVFGVDGEGRPVYTRVTDTAGRAAAAIVEALRVARAAGSIVAGETMHYKMRVSYRVDGVNGRVEVNVEPRPSGDRCSVVEGSAGGCRYAVTVCWLQVGKAGATVYPAGVRLECSAAPDWSAAARAVREAASYAAALTAGLEAERPSHVERVEEASVKPDTLGVGGLFAALRHAELLAWRAARLPLRALSVRGSLEPLAKTPVPGAYVDTPPYTVSYNARGGERDTTVEISGGRRVRLALRGGITTTLSYPLRELTAVDRARNTRLDETRWSMDVQAASSNTEGFAVLLRAALDDLRWLDRYPGDIEVTVRTQRGDTLTAVKKGDRWVARTPRRGTFEAKTITEAINAILPRRYKLPT